MELTEERIELSRGVNGLGFNIKGGSDQPYLKGDNGIFISKIRDSGTAYEDGRLKEGDKVLEVNGQNLRRATHMEAVKCFRDAGSKVVLLVQHNAEAYIKKKMNMMKEQVAVTNEVNDSLPIEKGENNKLKVTIISFSLVVVGVAGAFYYARKKNYRMPDIKLLQEKIVSWWPS